VLIFIKIPYWLTVVGRNRFPFALLTRSPLCFNVEKQTHEMISS
jgi:hypothetical protein